ncbi:MAG: FMN-binding protein [Ndongobacter sp.]|nr:FMN-binding protein [Ndongobacter sp.]
MKTWKKWIPVIGLGVVALTACGSGASYRAGTYEGSGVGYNQQEKIRLSVTVAEDGSLYEIKILEQNETPEIGGKALDTLIEEVLRTNSPQVDAVSNATRTTEGFREALNEALEQAK